MWYYSENNQQLGPISEEDLKQKTRSGGLKPATLVWKDGMSDWTSIAELPELAIAIQSFPAPAAPALSKPIASANPYATPQSTLVQRPAMQMAPSGAYINSGGILAFAIVTTVLCCLPFGIPAIVYAAKINSQLASGDTMGAHDSASKSKMWSWISLGLGVLFTILFFNLGAAGALG